MPGFSRTSVPADPADFAGAKIGEQVAALVRSLDVANATFYGCSAGGAGGALARDQSRVPSTTNAWSETTRIGSGVTC